MLMLMLMHQMPTPQTHGSGSDVAIGGPVGGSPSCVARPLKGMAIATARATATATATPIRIARTTATATARATARATAKAMTISPMRTRLISTVMNRRTATESTMKMVPTTLVHRERDAVVAEDVVEAIAGHADVDLTIPQVK